MEESTQNIPLFMEQLEAWLVGLGLSSGLAQFSKVAISLVAIAILSYLANLVAKKIIVAGVASIVKRTKTTWDNYLLERKVFHNLSHLAPALVIQFTIGIALYDYSPNLTQFIEKLTLVYIVVAWLVVLNSLLNALHDMYLNLEVSLTKPINGYIQMAKIILSILAAIIAISIVIDKNPARLLVGMGASAAILMLVFKDTILGLVASVQVSANNMVKPGDWIEMPSRRADGTVLEISLNTVKVRNWDTTISTIPTYALVSESFTNWKGMEEGGGRRIMRSVFIDMHSVKFCTPELLEQLKRVHLVKDYIEQRSKEIDDFNKEKGFDVSMPVNGRRMTNLGIFRRYVEFYLKKNPNINTDMIHMVRHLQPTERGIPIEIYCFSSKKAWVDYEGVQADLFDHILSVAPFFELKLFQSPSGDDVQMLAKGMEHR